MPSPGPQSDHVPNREPGVFALTDVSAQTIASTDLRHDWTRAAVAKSTSGRCSIWFSPRSRSIANFTTPTEVQLCQLLSIKTGGCPEDCAYCPQSAHYQTGVEHQDLLERRAKSTVPPRKAHDEGATPLLHGRGMARSSRRQGIRRRAGDGARASPRWEWKSAARWACSPTIRRAAWPTPVSPPTTTTSIPRRNSTARSSPRAATTIACAPSPRCAARASPSAAAASSAWANPTRTASACCISWPALDPHPGKRAHQHAGARRRHAAGRCRAASIRSRSCARSPPRAC